MKVLLLAAIVLASLAVPTATTAAPEAWVPGSAYYVEELDLSDSLERYYDSAYCDGITRFGKRGSFPYEKYRVFDCTTERDNDFCSDMRVKMIKAQRQGWWRWVKIRNGDCF